MDLQLVMKGLDYSQRRKKLVLVLAALGFTGYGVYRAYHLPSLAKKRKRLVKLCVSLVSMAEMVSDSAEAVGIVSKGLTQFIQSDSDKIPNSLRQISKIARSDELAESMTRLTRALTVGILRGYRSELGKGDPMSGNSCLPELVLDKLFTTAGSGFASVVVGSFARNLVTAFYVDRNNGWDASIDQFVLDSRPVPGWIDALCKDKCRELMADCIQLFVSTAVAVYLDKTMHVNTYDEIFSGMTNPKHETEVKEMLTSVCKGAVESLVRTSHQVLTSTDSVSNSNLGSCFPNGHCECPIGVKEEFDEEDFVLGGLKGKGSLHENQHSGWMTSMSSIFAVPSNRSFVLDVTGTVTFETIRSLLEFTVEKLSDSLNRSLNIVRGEVIDKGTNVVNYITAKSSTALTICLSLCLHILGSPWMLVPA